MKKIILILLAVFVSTGAFAQFNFGLKVGASSNNFDVKSVTGGTTATLESAKDASWGFHGGAFFRVSFLGLMVQPEIVFSMAENNMLVDDGVNPAELKSQKFNKLDIPVLLGVKLGPVRLMGGPAASVMLSSDTDIIGDAESLYKSATFGYQAGVGVDIKKITLDVRYEGGLANFGDEVSVGGETLTLDGRSNAFLLSLGFMF
ncbi:MAG: outer membrane beta-barrel protein [Bacteroidales bacterium]